MSSPHRLRLSCLLVAVAPAVAAADMPPGGTPSREDVRQSVAGHRAEQRAQIQADEALAGRRLTPAERAELREQLRSQWAARADSTQTAQSATPGSVSPGAAQTPPGSGGWRSLLPWRSNARQ